MSLDPSRMTCSTLVTLPTHFSLNKLCPENTVCALRNKPLHLNFTLNKNGRQQQQRKRLINIQGGGLWVKQFSCIYSLNACVEVLCMYYSKMRRLSSTDFVFKKHERSGLRMDRPRVSAYQCKNYRILAQSQSNAFTTFHRVNKFPIV